MSRTKHLISLIILAVFTVLTFLFTAGMQMILDSNINRADGVENNEILLLQDISEEDVTVSAANPEKVETWFEDGYLAIRLIDYSNEPVSVEIPVPSINFTKLKNESLVEAFPEYGEKMDEMLAGPWMGQLTYEFSADDYTRHAPYTVQISDQTISGTTDRATQVPEDTFEVAKQGTQTLRLTLVLEDDVVLGGTYRFKGSVKAVVDAASMEMNWIEAYAKLFTLGFKDKSLAQIFSVNNWLAFYGAMCLFGSYFFLWRDLHTCFAIARVVADAGFSQGVPCIITTYVNGQCVGSREGTIGGSSGIFAGIIAFLLSYFLLVLTMPIRILILVIRSVIALITGGENFQPTPVFGNIMGSLGIFLLTLGGIFLYAGTLNTVLSIVLLVASILMMIIASKLTKNEVADWIDEHF